MAGLLLYLFSAMQSVVMPDLRGISEEVARKNLEKAGLRLLVREIVYDDKAEPGTILDQSPPPLVRVKPGDAVSVVLSRGRQTVAVPRLEGLDRQAARQALEEKGLAVRFSEEFSEDVPLGQVVSHDPPASASVDLRSTVTVVVSKGPPRVAVPDLRGRTQEEATKLATRAGLKVSMVGTRADNTAPRNTVVDQKPTAGTKIARGSTIEITLSSGPETKRVPSLVGMTLSQARQAAVAAGFSLSVEGGLDDGSLTVREQDPAAGTEMPAGSRIVVTLETQPQPTPEDPSGDLVRVPNLVGISIFSARILLEETGLRVGNTETEKSDEAADRVLRQSPAADSLVKRGSPVDLVIVAPK